MDFTLWDAETGKITGRGAASLEEALANARNNIRVKLGVALDGNRYRIDPQTKDPIELAPVRTVADVQAERDRRLNEGFVYDFKDKRGQHRIGASDSDWIGWQEVSAIATKALMRDKPKTVLDIVTDTGPLSVTADEWLDILDAIEAFRQPIVLAAFSLMVREPIPADLSNDTLWKGAK